jgi:two-component system cell cycle sensor histidine kinase/response regulator CckA
VIEIPRSALVPIPVPEEERKTLFLELERSAAIGGYLWEPGRRLVWSDGFFRLLGLQPSSTVTADVFFERVHPEDRERVRQDWRRALNGEMYPTRYRIVRGDGGVRYLRGQGTITRGSDGSIARIVGTIADVTDIHQAAERLAGANATLAATQHAAGVGSYIFDLPTWRMEWSETLYEILSVDPSVKATPELAASLVHPDDRERQQAWGHALREGESVPPLLTRIVRPDGRIIHLETRSRRIVSEDGSPRILGVSMDVTARVELEAQLQQAAKMQAVGTLAAGVAHDFNNYLTVIRFQLDELRARGVEGPALEDAMHASDRCAALTRQLLAFGRQQPAALRTLDLGALVRNVAGLFRRVARPDITVTVRVPDGAVLVEGDAGQLEGALMNLAVNARDAMPAGGTVSFHLEERELHPGQLPLEPGSPPGRYACLRVIDTGGGIAPAHLSRVFDPYFSTKAPGSGSGLGLASVYGTVRQHGGFVKVESEIGAGTTLSVYLPVREARLVAAEAGTPEPRAAALAGLRILLAEDVEMVRRTLEAGLSRAGAQVTAAADGAAALARLAAGLEVDLVLTDIVMPHMGGMELAREARRLRPELPFAFMTGYADGEVLGELARHEPSSPVLSKPFTIEDLVRALGRTGRFTPR